MHKCVSIEYSRDLDSKSQFYNCGFDAYGEQFHNMNATLHYPQIGNGVCLVSYNTPAAFIYNNNGHCYIYYIKSSQTTERQITRFSQNLELNYQQQNVKRLTNGYRLINIKSRRR